MRARGAPWGHGRRNLPPPRLSQSVARLQEGLLGSKITPQKLLIIFSARAWPFLELILVLQGAQGPRKRAWRLDGVQILRFLCFSPSRTLRAILLSMLGSFWHVLELFWSLLGPSWGFLGSSYSHLGASSRSIELFGAILEHLGAILEPVWVHLRAVLGSFWGHAGVFLGILGFCIPYTQQFKGTLLPETSYSGTRATFGQGRSGGRSRLEDVLQLGGMREAVKYQY